MGERILKAEDKKPEIVWVDEKRASEITGFAIQTLRNWRFRGIRLPYCKVGRSVRYRLADVIAFMEQRRVNLVK